MKTKRIITSIVAIAATAMLVFSCITFNSIVYPSDPKANSNFDVTLQVQLVPETERDGYFILAFVAPKSWKVSETVTASYSATSVQVAGEEITIENEKMVLANDYIEPTTGMPYNSAMLSQYGVLGNTGPVEWIVLRGTTKINANGGGVHPTTLADVKISYKTGSNNIKYFTAFATCLSDNGFNTANAGEFLNSDTQMITVTGGKGDDDFTVLHFVSTTPQTVRYGDYMSIEFVSAIGDEKTELYGEKEVYMQSKAVLKDGKVANGPSTLMLRRGDDTYFKYIYPKSFFKVGEKAEIQQIYVWFTDKSGKKVVTTEEDGFKVNQSAE